MDVSIITEPRCRCCTSPYRLFIERQLVAGRNFSAIARQVPPNIEGKRVERRSVATHYYRHLDPVITRIKCRLKIEDMLRELGVDPDLGPLP
jgi:hypothetical protein